MGNLPSPQFNSIFSLVSSRNTVKNNITTETNMSSANLIKILQEQKNIVNDILKDLINSQDNPDDSIYDNKFIILGSYNTIVKAYHVNICKKKCPFTRPRLAVPDKPYKEVYIPYPSITELTTFHIDELNDFYKVYSEQRFPIYLGIYDNKSFENKIKNILPKDNSLKLFHIDCDNKHYLETIGIDFSIRFDGLAQPAIIVNSDSLNTVISTRNSKDWNIYTMNLGYTRMISILQRDFDSHGEAVSIIRRITDVQSIILSEIHKLDKIVNTEHLNQLPAPQILITGALSKTIINKKFNNLNCVDEIISMLEDEIINMCWTTEPIINMYNFYYDLANMILTSEIFKYFTSNITNKIKMKSQKAINNNNINVCTDWIMGKLLIDNDIYKY